MSVKDRIDIDYVPIRDEILKDTFGYLKKTIKRKAPKDVNVQHQLLEYLTLAHTTCLSYLDAGFGGEGSSVMGKMKRECLDFWSTFTGKKTDRGALKKMEEVMKFAKTAHKEFTKETKNEELLSNSEKAAYENDIMKINNPKIWKDGRSSRCMNPDGSDCISRCADGYVNVNLGGRRFCENCQNAAKKSAPVHLNQILIHKETACRHRMTIRQLSSLLDQAGDHYTAIKSQKALQDVKQKQKDAKDRATQRELCKTPRHLQDDRHSYRKCATCDVSMGYLPPVYKGDSAGDELQE